MSTQQPVSVALTGAYGDLTETVRQIVELASRVADGDIEKDVTKVRLSLASIRVLAEQAEAALDRNPS